MQTCSCLAVLGEKVFSELGNALDVLDTFEGQPFLGVLGSYVYLYSSLDYFQEFKPTGTGTVT